MTNLNVCICDSGGLKIISNDIYIGNKFTDWQTVTSVENTKFLYISKYFYIIEKNINIS